MTSSQISYSTKRSLVSTLNELLSKHTTPRDPQDASTAPLHAIVAGVTSPTETLYLGAKGTANVGSPEPASVEHLMYFFSCSKAVTATAILQLHEDGKLDIDGEASRFLPKIGGIGLIDEGTVSEEDGSFTVSPRKPKRPVTIKHLLLHTSGFAYAFTSVDYFHLMTKKDPHINPVTPVPEYFSEAKTPLVFEPGSKFLYGHSFDWLGLIIQEVTGMRLSEYLKKNIFDPLGMTSFRYRIEDEDNVKFMELHKRTRKAGVVVHNTYTPEKKPTLDMGGQGCFGTVGDYLKFMRVWLNYGISPDTGAIILQPDTIKYARMNHLPHALKLDFPIVSTDITVEGARPDGYSLAGCGFTNSRLLTGRSRTSLYWSGMGNLFFWIDFQNKIAGFWATQLYPYLDETAVQAYLEFETETYNILLDHNKDFKL